MEVGTLKKTIKNILVISSFMMALSSRVTLAGETYVNIPSINVADTFIKGAGKSDKLEGDQNILNHLVEYADRYAYGQSSRWTQKWWEDPTNTNYYLLKETRSNLPEHSRIQYEDTENGKVVQLISDDGSIVMRLTEPEYERCSKEQFTIEKNAWFQDRDGSWYLLSPDDGHIYSGLVHDISTDKWYYLSVNHDGTFGHLQKDNGFYTINGHTYRIEFNQSEDGCYGAVTKGLEVLQKSDIPTLETIVPKNHLSTTEETELSWLKKVDAAITENAISIYNKKSNHRVSSNDEGFKAIAASNSAFARYYAYKNQKLFEPSSDSQAKNGDDIVTKRLIVDKDKKKKKNNK